MISASYTYARKTETPRRTKQNVRRGAFIITRSKTSEAEAYQPQHGSLDGLAPGGSKGDLIARGEQPKCVDPLGAILSCQAFSLSGKRECGKSDQALGLHLTALPLMGTEYLSLRQNLRFCQPSAQVANYKFAPRFGYKRATGTFALRVAPSSEGGLFK